MLAVAAFVTVGGRAAGQQAFHAFALAWVAAGAINAAIALLQVFAPDVTDGMFIATSGLPGRAVGNLRQPNHLSSLLLWSCIAVIALHELGRLRRAYAIPLLTAFVFAVVLTASRTGLVSVALLALWGLADRRLSKPARLLLLAAPVVYALSWWLMVLWADLSQHSFGGSQRIAEADVSSSRLAIWRDTLALIRMHPWTGVGLGEFNFAWTLTPLPNRPTAFFDHTHNLPLQLLVELGIPIGGAILALLSWALWLGFRQAWSYQPAARSTAQRCAMLMVLMIGLHSLLEYPLWYSYFLLPAAWAWGFALQPGQGDDVAEATPRTKGSPWLQVASAAVVLGVVFSVFDYLRVAAIFTASDDAPPLAQRIAAGQGSVFFAHHADYAAVTAGLPVADPSTAFDRATHYLLDTRLMTAWAKSLAERGQMDHARHIAQRMREFRKAESEEIFAVCDAIPAAAAQPAAAASEPSQALPFQCQPPQRQLSWRDFLPASR
ncbi:MAG TPA: Wzy polymerase domain-containing protein [Rubrivivax sp.]|nr:Wzy polymerase domain-containing protein [Rubrivivax sp.]